MYILRMFETVPQEDMKYYRTEVFIYKCHQQPQNKDTRFWNGGADSTLC